MQTKSIAAILAYASIVTATTMPSGLVAKSDAEVADLPYPVSEMEWTGIVKGSETIKLTGTIESIIEQAREINPDFTLKEAEEVEARSVEERSMSDIICNLTGGNSGKAYVPGVMNQHSYLKGLPGNCGVNGRSCVRISCSYTDSVWLCNDNDGYISPRCSYLADYVGNIIAKCQNTTLANCRLCPFGVWTHLVNGQQFDTDRYNIIVRRDNSC